MTSLQSVPGYRALAAARVLSSAILWVDFTLVFSLLGYYWHADATTIVCHDAARPFATPALFVRVIEGLRDVDGCIPTVPVPDTLKRTRDGRVLHTIPREDVVLAQTPQAFVCASLRAAHDAEDVEEATDDALLLEARGMPIATVAGEPGNFKITTPEDLRRAEEIVTRRGLAPAQR